MRTNLSLLALSVFPFFLTACSDAQNDPVKQAVNEQLRAGFITVASEQCMNRIPQDQQWVSEDKVRQICDCTAGKMFDSVSPQDLTDMLAGKINQELTDKLSNAALACAEESIAQPAASAASSETPRSQ
ncbi:hypothetical protein [Neisseria sp. CCUG12390]|uniref:hypothetical protein n=1 Tax=Neisseria sp. CCUG12390 TaxID=3392035 RepID=UPI003A100727